MPTQSKTLIKFRSTVFERRGGRCYYCDFPTWLSSIGHFACLYGIAAGQAKQVQCTAEHLLAQQGGVATLVRVVLCAVFTSFYNN